MKLALAIDMQTSKAVSEIQFGHIERPIHTNTAWDVARFETCAHRWLRVAEPNFGVTIANDSTYGHDITRKQHENGRSYVQIRESLMRSPVYPDPNTDQGMQTVRTSLKVGASVSDSISEGFRMNLALRSHMGANSVEPLISISSGDVVIESVKLAEDESGDLIVRLYEGLGSRTSAAITANFEYQKASLVDLLEEPLASQADLALTANGGLQLELRPFKIATLRFKRY
jgi:alpha-mannosidase